ncbi:MAG: hypothetical protein ACI87Q_002669, partial [Pseudohongiellaceae bacterium]
LPLHSTRPHLTQIYNEVSKVIVVATLSIEYMFYGD